MKITFITNRLTFHQEEFCKNISKENDVKFKIVTVKSIPKSRLSYYPNYKKYKDLLVNSYENKANSELAKILADESDVVIIGSAPDSYIKNRLQQGKLTFKYSERFYKNGLNIKTFPRAIIGSCLHYGRFSNKPLYLLCASAYTSADVNIFSNYKNKTYKWGYFPKVSKYDLEELFKLKTSDTVQILWCGRFLDWKHPEKAIYVAEKLKKDGYKFKLMMIGIGELHQQIDISIKEKNLEDHVELLGSMSPEKVRKHMDKANMFLFTSDFNEGWGAVLNEAMNSACAVVASHAIGSVPYLIKDAQNGLVYKNEDLDDLYNKVKFLIDNPNIQKEFGVNAYNTLKNEWNAGIAANRLIQLVKEIQNKGECDLFKSGPCSRAEILKNNWYNGIN